MLVQSFPWKRWFIFFLGLFFMGNGIAIVTNANLGTTPISSLPYVVAKILGISMGMGTFLINALMLTLQIPILGKLFKVKNFLQLPCVFVFGLFIDLGMWLTHSLIPHLWHEQMIMCIIGCFIMSIGIMLELTSQTTVIPGEGLVLAISWRSHHNFGHIKVLFDVSLVICAFLVSWLYFQSIEGLREGTAVTALCTGFFVRFISKACQRRISCWLER